MLLKKIHIYRLHQHVGMGNSNSVQNTKVQRKKDYIRYTYDEKPCQVRPHHQFKLQRPRGSVDTCYGDGVAEATVEAATWQGPSWRAGGRSLTREAAGLLPRPGKCTRHGPHHAEATINCTTHGGSLVHQCHVVSLILDGWTLGAIHLA